VDCLREPVGSPDAVALLRAYFAELTVRYFHRETTEQEIDETLGEFPSTGLALHAASVALIGRRACVASAQPCGRT
jgi:hypothetical protein